MTKIVRKPAVAGMFYPDDADELRHMVVGFLHSAKTGMPHIPKAIIAPHAGYIYSGPVAGSAYMGIIAAKNTISRVVLLGPSHRVPLSGIAASSATHFATPLGLVPLDRETIERLLEYPQVNLMDDAHAQEHSLEVHLPFLQEILDHFSLVPLVVGEAKPEQVSEILEEIWGGPETLIVISSDLSHYHDYETACSLDKGTSQAIETLQPESIGYEQACGRNPVNGLLTLARQFGLSATTIDLRNSGDTAGPQDRVVGYGAYWFH